MSIQPDRVWQQIMESAELIRDLGDREMLKQAAHITYGQSKVLRLLFRHHPARLMQKEIAEALGLTKGAVSQTIDALHREGFVLRESAESDHRATYLRLSEKGMAVQQRHVKGYNSLLHGIINGEISEADAMLFLDVLERILNGLKKRKRDERRAGLPS